MKLEKLKQEFAVCKLDSIRGINFDEEFVFYSKTDDEISLVCDTKKIPDSAINIEKGWKGLKICGTLDFGMVGVIANISSILAKDKISIFVVSTYNTDFIFVKEDTYSRTINLLKDNGYDIAL